jgi:hypothetical protein
MQDQKPGTSERPTGWAVMSASEKLMCEWEARHDVAARGRTLDPALSLSRYLTHTRADDNLRHRGRPARRSDQPSARHGRQPDGFAAQHPLTASWLRWGEDPR